MVDFGDRDRLSDFHLRHADHAGRGAGSADAAPARSAAASHRPFVAPGGGSGSAVVVPPALPARAPVRGLPAALPPAVPPAPSSGGGGGGGGGGSSTSSASTSASASASSSGSRVTAVTSTAVPAPPSGVPAATLSRQQTDGAPRGHSVDANRPDGIVVRSTIATPRDGSRRRIDAAAATAAAASAPSAVVAANRQERIGSTDRTEEIPDEPVPTETKKEKKRREAIERLNKLSEEFLKQKERLYHDQLEFLEREMKELQEGTHREFLEGMNDLEEERERVVRDMEFCYQYEVVFAERFRDAEVQEAEDEYKNEIQALRERIRNDIEERRKKAREEVESMDIHHEPPQDSLVRLHHTRNLRRRGLELDQPAKPSRRFRQSTRPVQVSAAKEGEILEDLMLIRNGQGLLPSTYVVSLD